jgi:hypothetical protein
MDAEISWGQARFLKRRLRVGGVKCLEASVRQISTGISYVEYWDRLTEGPVQGGDPRSVLSASA